MGTAKRVQSSSWRSQLCPRGVPVGQNFEERWREEKGTPVPPMSSTLSDVWWRAGGGKVAMSAALPAARPVNVRFRCNANPGLTAASAGVVRIIFEVFCCR